MSVYIPPHKRDTRYPLWFVRYRVRVPYIQMIDTEDLINNGLPTSGDPHHDHAMQWEPRHMSLPIHRIAELWSNGANVSLTNPKDALPIYQAIEAHLTAWKNKIETQFNPGSVPEEDLIVLDRFASIIYEHAKPLFSNEFVAANFRIAGRRSGSRRNAVSSVDKMEETKRQHLEKNKENLIFSKIKVVKPQAGYDPKKVRAREQVDYSGEEQIVVAPPRVPLTSFLRKN